MTEADAAPAISLPELQRLTEPMAHYARSDRGIAESILRSGLVEEAMECIYGQKVVAEEDAAALYEAGSAPLADPEALADQAGEIGDMWWYISEISRRFAIPAAQIVVDAPDLDAFQDREDFDLLPIASPNGPSLKIENDHRAVLAIAALRVVDVMNPKTDELWRGLDGRPTLGRALADLARATSYMATHHGIRLSAAVSQTMSKLAERARQPAVIDQASEQEVMSSAQRRLAVVPWVATLLAQASVEQWRHMAKPYDR